MNLTRGYSFTSSFVLLPERRISVRRRPVTSSSNVRVVRERVSALASAMPLRARSGTRNIGQQTQRAIHRVAVGEQGEKVRFDQNQVGAGSCALEILATHSALELAEVVLRP